LHLRPFFRGSQSYRFAFSQKNMTQHIFSFESELQNNQAEVAPSSPNFSLSVSEKLACYGVNALSDVEHLGLLVGKEMLAARLLAHFGSLKTLAKVSTVELRSFMTIRQAERLVAALAVSARVQTQDAYQEPFDSPETVYRSCIDMQSFRQEVLRVILLDTRFRRITTVDITKGTVNESLAHPREIFRPAIIHSAYALVVVHNHPSGDPSPSEADSRLTRRLSEGSRLLQIQMLDHVIVGAPAVGRSGYFSFKEAGLF
jgi:DNA repair protein RadC